MIHKLALPMSALLLGAALAGGALRAQPPAPFTIVETGQTFSSLQDAVGAIGGGQGTIRIAPGRYEDCAVQEAGRVTFIAETRGHGDLRRRHLRGQGDFGAARTLGARGGAGLRPYARLRRQRRRHPHRAWRPQRRPGDVRRRPVRHPFRHRSATAPSRSTNPPSAGSARSPTATAPTASISAIMARSGSPTAGSSAAPAAIISRAARRASRR